MPHPTHRKSLAFVCLGAGLLLSPAAVPLAGQEPAPRHHEGLGSLVFPTSGSPQAQPHFERGVLLMHSFEYDDAAAAFRAAQQADPGFAMAYWGEAMTHNHPVWNEQDRDAARAVLARYAPTPAARRERAPTERERMYLEAVDVLYGEGAKATRDTLYARAMAALVEAHPDDFEARAFHALSILGLSQGARDVPGYMRAGAIALDLFEANPGHPGAAHYVIHSFDDPTHAPLGLGAALAYADIAPDAAHAQHMTTHIFLALGMWNDLVEANERADAVVDRGRARRGLPATDCGHYNEWLAYGYQQQGREEEAGALVSGCMAEAAEQPGRAISATGMRALHLASTEDFDGPVAHRELALAPLSDWARAPSPWSSAGPAGSPPPDAGMPTRPGTTSPPSRASSPPTRPSSTTGAGTCRSGTARCAAWWPPPRATWKRPSPSPTRRRSTKRRSRSISDRPSPSSRPGSWRASCCCGPVGPRTPSPRSAPLCHAPRAGPERWKGWRTPRTRPAARRSPSGPGWSWMTSGREDAESTGTKAAMAVRMIESGRRAGWP